jgi:hypothetical protein
VKPVINSLDDLERRSRQWAEDVSELSDEFVLGGPGLPPSEIEQLRKDLPGLPDSYIACLARFDLAKVGIGYFGLAPTPRAKRDVGERLRLANSDANPFADLLREADLYEVASFEGDPVTVRAAGSTRPGEVVWIDTTKRPDLVARPLAPDFETFLILAGRLYDAGDDGEAVDGFFARLGDFDVPSAATDAWRAVASISDIGGAGTSQT